MAYTQMGGSPTINLLFYTYIGGSSVPLSIGLQQCTWFLKTHGQGLHTCWWFTNGQYSGLHAILWFANKIFKIFTHLIS